MSRKRVWWLVMRGVNRSHLWDGEVFDRLRDAQKRFTEIDTGYVQLIRQESVSKWEGASHNKIIQEKDNG